MVHRYYIDQKLLMEHKRPECPPPPEGTCVSIDGRPYVVDCLTYDLDKMCIEVMLETWDEYQKLKGEVNGVIERLKAQMPAETEPVPSEGPYLCSSGQRGIDLAPLENLDPDRLAIVILHTKDILFRKDPERCRACMAINANRCRACAGSGKEV